MAVTVRHHRRGADRDTVAPASPPASPQADTAGMAGMAGTAAAVARRAAKVYGEGDIAVRALDGVDVTIERATFTAVMGPSGSGKSTLVHCLAGLDTLTSGEIELGGQSLAGMRERDLTILRRDHVGFVFQSFNLIPTLTAVENLTLPADLAHRRVDREWLDIVIDALSLRDRLHHRPGELSGGQQQRVAIARSLVARPEIIFADEPTGNLDTTSAAEVLAILRRAVDQFAQTVVMVTHDPGAAAWADRVVFLVDGRVEGELQAPTTGRVLEHMKHLGS